MGDLSGRIAIVTGGARGIGRCEALALANAGATVVVNDLGSTSQGDGSDEGPAHEVAAEISRRGGAAIANSDDVSSWDGGQHLIAETIDRFGRLDIVVCNAGIVRDRMVFNMSEQEWDDVLRVHLKGHFVPTRFAAEHWRSVAKSTGEPANGRLVYTSSHMGLFGNEGQINYGVAKAGIALMGRSVARELAKYGVTVNTICPGGRTRLMTDSYPELGVVKEGEFDPLAPENVAPWVVYLCTDHAADISGQTFGVTGGRVELLEGWTVASAIERPACWTVDELAAEREALFAGRSTSPPRGLGDLSAL